jgi:hypothetical protein
MRHYTISRKVAGSIPDEVSGLFNLSNSSSRIMALGLTQPLIEMSTTYLPGGKGRPACKADNLTGHLLADSLENVGASTACYKNSFLAFAFLQKLPYDTKYEFLLK